MRACGAGRSRPSRRPLAAAPPHRAVLLLLLCLAYTLPATQASCSSLPDPLVLDTIGKLNTFAADGCLVIPGALELRGLDFLSPPPAFSALAATEIQGYLLVEDTLGLDTTALLPNLATVFSGEGAVPSQGLYAVRVRNNTGLRVAAALLDNVIAPDAGLAVRWEGNTDATCLGDARWMLRNDSLVTESLAECGCAMLPDATRQLCVSLCNTTAGGSCTETEACAGAVVQSAAGLDPFVGVGCQILVGQLRLSGLGASVPDSTLDAAFASVERITGALSVANSPGVEGLDFLPRLETVASVALTNNANLLTAELPNLSSVGPVAAADNPQLCSGLGVAPNVTCPTGRRLRLAQTLEIDTNTTLNTVLLAQALTDLVAGLTSNLVTSLVSVEQLSSAAGPGVNVTTTTHRFTAEVAEAGQATLKQALLQLANGTLALAELLSVGAGATAVRVTVPYTRDFHSGGIEPPTGLALALRQGTLILTAAPEPNHTVSELLHVFEFREVALAADLGTLTAQVRTTARSSAGLDLDAAGLVFQRWRALPPSPAAEAQIPLCASAGEVRGRCLAPEKDYELRVRVFDRTTGAHLATHTAPFSLFDEANTLAVAASVAGGITVTWTPSNGTAPLDLFSRVRVWAESPGGAWATDGALEAPTEISAAGVSLTPSGDGLTLTIELAGPFVDAATGVPHALHNYTRYQVGLYTTQSSAPLLRTGSTAEAAPISPPGEVVSAVTDSTAELLLTLPLDPQGAITTITLELSSPGALQIKTSRVPVTLSARQQGLEPGAQLTVSITGLQALTEYGIAALASTAAGAGPTSSSVAFTTTQGPPQQMGVPEVTEDESEGTFLVTWAPPPVLTTTILSYELIRFSAEGVPELIYAGPDEEFTVRSVGAGIAVRMVTTTGVGELSAVGQAEAQEEEVLKSAQRGNIIFLSVLMFLAISTAIILLYHYRGRFGAFSLPVDPEWEVPLNDLLMNDSDSLGQGAFGTVYSGLLNKEGTYCPVAIKTLSIKSEVEKTQAIAELEILKKLALARHPNVIRLLATRLRHRPCLVALELCGRGSLQDFLRAVRRTEGKLSGSTPLLDRLVRYALGVASGMTHIVEQGILHRDLAARNILITKKDQVKIADFGLAYQLGPEEEELVEPVDEKDMRPVRWMAPESLESGVYSSKSDVWGFGVTAWEILSYGRQPYAGLSNTEVVLMGTRGIRLEHPDGCPNALYSLMMRCWENKPEDRLTFPKLQTKLKSLQNRLIHDMSGGHDLLCTKVPVDGDLDSTIYVEPPPGSQEDYLLIFE